ncbi:HAD hydrolase-like protein [Allobaculum sp. Allo2]|uniref:HAD hydrolase-like protein n=1 Tax=Allobaculum sp. Allo2 TaxID=2853432 RepID=UPI0034625A28
MYARTCKALGKTLLPDEILVIGDSWKADILGAIAFGAPSLWIRVNRQHDPFEKRVIRRSAKSMTGMNFFRPGRTPDIKVFQKNS